jgi:tetrahydromethanopterin S-methyltransferase subunit G
VSKDEKLYRQLLDPSVKLNIIAERLDDVQDMVDDVNQEICRNGFDATW